MSTIHKIKLIAMVSFMVFMTAGSYTTKTMAAAIDYKSPSNKPGPPTSGPATDYWAYLGTAEGKAANEAAWKKHYEEIDACQKKYADLGVSESTRAVLCGVK